MSKYEMVVVESDGIALAQKLNYEEQDIKLIMTMPKGIKDQKDYEKLKKDNERLYQNILEKVKSPSPDATIIFGMIGNAEMAEYLMKKGYKVIGASKWSDFIELKREEGIELARSCGFAIPQYHKFNTIQEGLNYISNNPKRWVFKPDGNLDLDLTYVSKDAQDMVEQMQNHIPYRIKKRSFPYLLQEYIEGITISTEAWWNGSQFQYYNSTFEDKKFMTGDLGVNTGSETNVVWAWGDDCPLKSQFDKLAAYLLSNRIPYKGCIDVNCIVRKDKWYFLEWTPRFGYDAIFNLIELLDIPFHQFIDMIISGDKLPPLKEGFAASVRMSVEPYPVDDVDAPEALGIPIQGLDKDNIPHLWFNDVMWDDESKSLVCAGVNGLIGVATGTGNTIESAVEQAYKVVKSLHIPNVMYRIDAGKRAKRDFSALKQQGYIKTLVDSAAK